MSIQPDAATLDQLRIEARLADWARAGREVYKREVMGDAPCRPSDIIRAAEAHTCPSKEDA